MKTEEITEYLEHGMNVRGKLVLVDYQESYLNRKLKFYSFGAGDVFDYINDAKLLVEREGYKVKRIILGMPVYLVEVE